MMTSTEGECCPFDGHLCNKIACRFWRITNAKDEGPEELDAQAAAQNGSLSVSAGPGEGPVPPTGGATGQEPGDARVAIGQPGGNGDTLGEVLGAGFPGPPPASGPSGLPTFREAARDHFARVYGDQQVSSHQQRETLLAYMAGARQALVWAVFNPVISEGSILLQHMEELRYEVNVFFRAVTEGKE